MNRWRIAAGLVLSFLLLVPAVSEGKKKKTASDPEFRDEGRTRHRAVQETMDLSGYGTIDEIKRISLQTELKRMIMQHNERQKGRKTKIKTYQYSNTADSKNSRFKVENFNYLDIGSYGFITEVDQRHLEKQLNELIKQHNLYSTGKLKRPGSVRFPVR